jgi:acetyltransferase-like isoleucine patch superfamily enzyme
MLSLIKSYFTFFSKILRFFYWQYRWLNNAKTGKNGRIHLPLKFEGNGTFTTKNNFLIGENVFLGLSKNALFESGEGLRINDNAKIIVCENSKLIAKDNFKIDTGAKAQVNGIWEFGNNVNICTNAEISSREPGYYGNLIVGDNSEIGDNVMMDVSANITIGKDVSIGNSSIIYSHNHLYNDKSVAAWKGGVVTAPIIIEEGAWVASNVTILPGVTIGKRAVVAAGSVVVSNVEAECVYGGVPAKLIKRIS